LSKLNNLSKRFDDLYGKRKFYILIFGRKSLRKAKKSNLQMLGFSRICFN